MVIVWDKSSQYFIRNLTHTPRQWESFYFFEEASCWNCGGEFLVETRTPLGHFDFTKCFFCGGLGVAQWSLDPVEFNPNWTTNLIFNNIRYIDGNSNLLGF